MMKHTPTFTEKGVSGVAKSGLVLAASSNLT
jgi:hypothetical protein